MFHLVALPVVHSVKHLRGKMRSGRKYYSRDLTLNSDHITAANYDVMRVSGMERVHLIWGGQHVNISAPPSQTAFLLLYIHFFNELRIVSFQAKNLWKSPVQKTVKKLKFSYFSNITVVHIFIGQQFWIKICNTFAYFSLITEQNTLHKAYLV
jgi:hypothetical protein